MRQAHHCFGVANMLDNAGAANNVHGAGEAALRRVEFFDRLRKNTMTPSGVLRRRPLKF